MAYELPRDMVREILTRLSAKSLTRFKSLSKDHLNLIKSSSFIADHLHQSTHRNSSLLINTNKGLYFLRYESLEDLNNLVPFGPFPVEGFKEFDVFSLDVMGCSNGLLCVLDVFPKLGSPILIWNPATGQIKPIYFRNYDYRYRCRRRVLGFGFNSKEKDYKIVIIPKECGPCPDLSVNVFSLATGSWKESEHDSLKSLCFKYLSVTANGSLYWRAFSRDPMTKIQQNMIISFDLSEEVFGRIAFPSCDDNSYFKYDDYDDYDDNHDLIVLTVYDGSLALFLPRRLNLETVFELWVLQNDGGGEHWMKICSLAVGYQILNGRDQPLAVWKNIIIFNSEDWPTDATGGDSDHTKIFKVNSYNGQSYKISVVHGSLITHNITFLYQESLVPL